VLPSLVCLLNVWIVWHGNVFVNRKPHRNVGVDSSELQLDLADVTGKKDQILFETSELDIFHESPSLLTF